MDNNGYAASPEVGKLYRVIPDAAILLVGDAGGTVESLDGASLHRFAAID
jgi:hypothetical protein